jgi:hypothetical protein
MAKPTPVDPTTQFICDSCGRTYNFSLLEDSGGQEICEDCFKATHGLPPSTPEQRMVRLAQKNLKVAQQKLDEANRANEAATAKRATIESPGFARGSGRSRRSTPAPVPARRLVRAPGSKVSAKS